MSDIVVTADEANRLATGLTGAAAAERLLPPRQTHVARVEVYVEPGASVDARRYTYHGAGDSGWVTLGPLALSGTWDVLEATLVAALEAVRVARTGPVGA